MSYGKMNAFIDIIRPTITKDSDGFKVTSDEILASVRAYREGRHGSERWANRAAFTDATDLFRFRWIPGVDITTDMVIVCRDDRLEITSVENIKGRWQYIEVLTKEVKPSG
ncbi:MAG: phage head closure protein [Clostridia bacterium]|nr:phage head closure protein [Clostridia bacterium]